MAQKLVCAEVPRRVLYRVEEAVVLLGLSRSQLYELIRSGRLQTVREGRVGSSQPRRSMPTCHC
jgi:excisionase family DNA binding protein